MKRATMLLAVFFVAAVFWAMDGTVKHYDTECEYIRLGKVYGSLAPRLARPVANRCEVKS